MIEDEKYLIVHTHCFLVNGISNHIIQDVLRNRIVRIPVEVFNFLVSANKNKIKEIKRTIDRKLINHIKDIFNFLIENEFIFFSDEPDNFPSIDTAYEVPELITNSIIDYSSDSDFDVENILLELDQLGCKHLEIRFFDYVKLEVLKSILDISLDTRLLSIKIITKYTPSYTPNIINEMIEDYPHVDKIIIHSTPVHIIEKTTELYPNILYVAYNLTSEICCGIINQDLFSINIVSHTISKNYNSCLFKKISVDKKGNIKICPSMKEVLGNVYNMSLYDIVVSKPQILTSYWSINKDQIETCKFCEYRYSCTDCRAYLEDPHNLYSKPLKCGYDPYTGEWEEWSTNPLKQQAIEYYGMQELVRREPQKTA